MVIVMLKQQLINSSKYDVKCPYEMNPEGICIHNTANDASAQNERDNVNREDNNAEVSFHIAIDDIESIQLIPFNRNTWHAGDGGNGQGNRKYISIEICYSKSGGDRFNKAEAMAARVVAKLLNDYGWGIDKVKAHRDFSNKNCPHRTDMNNLKQMIQSELNGSSANNSNNASISTSDLYRVRKSWGDASTQKGAYSNFNNAKIECDKNYGYSIYNSNGIKVYPVTTPVPPTPPISTSTDSEVKRYSENGKCTITVDAINFRDKPSTDEGVIQGQYYNNESVNYDLVVITEKYIWISWIGGNGSRRYMPITQKSNNEKWAYCV
ncbi:N-acetylmuramoyl-L-alanine amidase [Clostridium gasigenes]|nr:N-acetylmuramoyl-L-alanine amidase [Clostridium gasigenes]